jgi:putative ABC transport system permease protein
MEWLKILIARWRALLRRDAVIEDIEEEMRAHIEMETQTNIERGMQPEEARASALRSFGNLGRVKELAYEIRGGGMMDTLWQDARFGLRMLAKNPGFTAVAVLTLALGIGANTAIFSVVNGVLLRPLPYPKPQQLAIVWSNRPQLQARTGLGESPVAAADFVDWRSQNQSFAEMAALHSQAVNLTGAGEPELLGGVRASASLFPLLGVEAAFGRTFLPAEDQPGSRVVLISHGLWQRRFGADPNVIGSTLTLNNEAHTVVGILPPDFQFPRRGELPAGHQFPRQVECYLPLSLTPNQASNRGRHYLAVVGRLKPQVTIAQAQAEMDSIAQSLQEQYPQTNTDKGVRLVSLHQQVVGKVRKELLVLLGAVAFVLLIACANVANLLLARAAARRKEMAIRLAMGARRSRVARQLLTESVLLALLGGGLGWLLAFSGIDLLGAISPGNLPRLDTISLDSRVLLFTLLISLITGLVFGLAPALAASRPDLNETLKEGGRSSSGAHHHRFRRLLVVAEIALSLVLLIGAGLMIRSFARLMSVDAGINAQNVLTLDILLPRAKYDSPRQAAFFEQIIERMKALPGVESAGAVYPLPLSGGEEGSGFQIEGQPPPAPGQSRSSGPRWVSSDYFHTLGVTLLKGRAFTSQDGSAAPRVMVINEAMARSFFPDTDPLGKRIAFNSTDGAPNWREIVGVVKDVRHRALDADPRPEMYFPFTQFPLAFMTVVLRTSDDPRALIAAARSQVLALDKDQPISNIHTMEELVANSTAQRRFNMLLLSIFAVLALVLAAVGIYGVMSYAVTERTHEIGVRLALGAPRREVLKLIVGQGMLLTGIGVALGLAGAFALTRLMTTLLFEVSATDTVTFVGITMLLAFVAFSACYVPARRATKVDPMVALRYE